MRVVVVPLRHLKTASVAVYVGTGARHESPRTNGTSHFLEHMLFRGTAQHPTTRELTTAIETLGATLNAATHVDTTVYHASVPPENLGPVLGLVGEMFTSPALAGIDTEREVVIEEMREEIDDRGHDSDVDNLSRRALFGAHPLGFKITGTPANVKRFSVRDLHAFRRKHYVGDNVVVALAGRVDPATCVKLAARAFGAVPRGPRPRARAAPRTQGPRVVSQHARQNQVELRVSFRAFGERDHDRPALQLAARILDDGLSTRLNHRLTEELGLAYEVFGGLDLYADTGVFDVGAAVEPKKLVRTVREILNLFDELRTTPVPAAELDKARRRAAWQREAMVDAPELLAGYYGLGEIFGVREHLDVLAGRADALTASDVLRVSRRVFRRQNLTLAWVGRVSARDAATLRRLARTF